MCEFIHLVLIYCLGTPQKDLCKLLLWEEYGTCVYHMIVFSVNNIYPFKTWIWDITYGSSLTTMSDTDTPSGSVVMWLMIINPPKGFVSHSSGNMPNTLIYYVLTLANSVQNTLKIHVFWYILIHNRVIIVIPMI